MIGLIEKSKTSNNTKWCKIDPTKCDKKCLMTGVCSRKGKEPRKKNKDET